MTKRPNILMIQADDQRYDTISGLGNKEIDTPNLDQLVRTGTTFTHAHNLGSNHEAVCIPSRAMMLTGRSLFSLFDQGKRIPDHHETLPEWFRKQGYITSHVGKWHQDRETHARCFSTGDRIFGFKEKDGWYEPCNGHWHTPVHDFDRTGIYNPQGGYHDPPLQKFGEPFEICKDNGRHSAEVFSDAAIRFLAGFPRTNEARQGAPFFLYLAHIAPHDPRQFPSRYRTRYAPDRVTLPPNYSPQPLFDNGELLVRDELLEAHPRRPERVREHIAEYYSLIAFLDEQIGRVLEALERSGEAENTIILFFADHGISIGQHGLMGKQNLYDHSVRIPLIIKGPGIPQDERAHTLCALSDLFPTLCELSQLSIPDGLDGKSLLPAIQDPSYTVHNNLFFAYKDYQRAIKRGNYKRIDYKVQGNYFSQLFDLDQDPYETRNLANDSDFNEIFTTLGNELFNNIKRTKNDAFLYA